LRVGTHEPKLGFGGDRIADADYLAERANTDGCERSKRRRGQILGFARVFPAPIFLLEEDFSRELHGAGVVGEVELLLVELRGGDIDEVTRACSCGCV
jgi:hypothetical protein